MRDSGGLGAGLDPFSRSLTGDHDHRNLLGKVPRQATRAPYRRMGLSNRGLATYCPASMGSSTAPSLGYPISSNHDADGLREKGLVLRRSEKASEVVQLEVSVSSSIVKRPQLDT